MIYTSGVSINPDGNWRKIPESEIKSGDYVLNYGCPKFVFAFLSSSVIDSAVSAWMGLRNLTDFTEQVTIKGVSIDDETGEIYLAIHIDVTGPDTQESGFNPWVVLSIVAGLFTALGIGVTLLGVYVTEQVTGSAINNAANPEQKPTIDPCTEDGIVATIKCWTRKASWVTAGVLIGVVLVTLLLLGFFIKQSAA